MEGSYNFLLVALSYVVATAASYTALELSRRVSQTTGRAALAWLIAGAFSMGVGIWTMHFVGMLAFSMDMPFAYDVPITVLSLFVGMSVAGFAIYIASQAENSPPKIVLSGLLLGGGIAAMHYTGMAAMRMDATLSYDPVLFALSIMIAVVAACAAIWIIFTLSYAEARRVIWWKTGAALVMGLAICGMHYTGMAAAIYTPHPGVTTIGSSPDHLWLAITVGVVALLILGFTQLTIFFDYKLDTEKRRGLQLDRVLDDSSNEVYFIDAETHHIVYSNRSAIKNLGYTREELRRMTPADFVRGLDRHEIDRMIDTLSSGSKRELAGENVHVRRDGTEYPTQGHLQYSTVHERPMLVVIVADVTERRALEAQLRQSQKLESIGQLAAGIAHEINTPAQYVNDNIQFIKEALDDLVHVGGTARRLLEALEVGELTPRLINEVRSIIDEADLAYLKEEVPSAIAQSQDGIDRIARIVRAIKAFSHPGSSGQDWADLNAGIRNTLTVSENAWKYVAEVQLSLDENLPLVLCHAQAIDQVVLNLVVNAAHAIGPTVEVGGEKGVIRISTGTSGTGVAIEVSDTGCGIPAEIVGRVFDPFFTTKDVGDGSGQGLAMAHHCVVEKHQGKLTVESVEGQGATFRIWLPLKSGESAETLSAAA